jgi:uncharacterized iron-regulated protein
MRLILTFFFATLVNNMFSQVYEAYKLYDGRGNAINVKQMLSDIEAQDVICFGELHNDPIIHWLQLEVTKALGEKRLLMLGAEMFETDDQVVLDEYLLGKIKEDHLKKETKIWPNYQTDYRPLVEWAKENQRPFIATNVPRRYASLVSREGIDALLDLDDAAKSFMPSLPYGVRENDRGYEEMKNMMGGAHGSGMGIENMIAAQALKDYTMAQMILKNRENGTLFIHYNGSFHSQYRAGMAGYLLDASPKLKLKVIAAVSGETLDFLDEYLDLGDYIIVTPSNMTKTH